MKTYRESKNLFHLDNQEKQIINLKKELVFLKIKQKTKQNIKPHLIKKIKNKISKILTFDRLNYKKST
uniref:Ribosomal protein L29 n=1 Tax=Laurencieae sp. TaxID=2007162 RepID=A0A1Z1M2E2_9FLOR|nr:ribosomal protein L29 [Laurencieae sp.]